MSEFFGTPLGSHLIPNDLTTAEFMLNCSHPLRPAQGSIPCLIEDATGRQVSLNELRERTLALAHSLREKYKIGENDVVLVCSPNHIDYPVTFWAPQYIGAIFTGTNPNSTAAELVYHIKLSGATLIIAHSGCFETARKAAALTGIPSDRVLSLDYSPSLKDATSVATLISASTSAGSTFVPRKLLPGEGKTKIAVMCLSSGTTGQPKAVAISHSAIISNVVQLSALNPDVGSLLRPGDVALGLLPFFHIAGMVFNLHWMLFCATTLVVVPNFNLIGMLDSITRYRMQHLVLVPPMAVALCKSPVVKKYDLSKIKFITCGAAPMTSELQGQLSQLCPQAKIAQVYGATEAPAAITMTPISRPFTAGSAGNLMPGMQARLIKSDGSLAGYNEPGELLVKSPSLALGYYKNKKASDEVFTPDGWLRTGDEAKINEQGEVFIIGRLKELIKVRAFQVSPAELEGLILNHPDVSDVCVMGVPDDFSGEVPRAFVVLTEVAASKAKTDPERIKTSISKLVADNKIKYKHLAGGVTFVPLIPKNPSGKILRRVLKEQMAMEQAKAKL
ncbi:phenylacetyl-CoA ligase [Mycena galopus ATCC 62051]|nr:phenylacetyl-CoA ligase [Mycena galopus ATCC 62051]